MTYENSKSASIDLGAWSLPKAVVFDFDGVILESAEIKTEAFLELFSHYPEHREAIRRYHIENLGISRYRKFEWIHRELLRRPLEEERSRELGNAFSQIVFEKILRCRFVPGASELLETLENRTHMFVASGTPQEELEAIIDARSLRRFFREVWGTPLSKIEIIQSILSRHSLTPEQVVFVGDGISDYRAAQETGVVFLARETDQVDVDWRALGAITIADLTAALPLLKNCPSSSGLGR